MKKSKKNKKKRRPELVKSIPYCSLNGLERLSLEGRLHGFQILLESGREP